MKKQKGIGKDLLTVSIITTVAVGVWIALDVYWTMQKTEIPKVLAEQLEPLNPKLDLPVLDQLERESFFDIKEEGSSFFTSYNPEPEPEIEPEPETETEPISTASPAAEIEESTP